MLIEFFDYLLRFGTIINLVWTIVFFSICSVRIVHPQIAIATAISLICHLIVSAYDEHTLFGPLLGAVVEFLARILLGVMWLFCLSLFKDKFRMQSLHFFVLGFYIARSILFQMEVVPDEFFRSISLSFRTIIYAYLIYVILSEYSGDLIEKRRTFRLWFAFAMIFVPFIVTLERIFISATGYSDRISLFETVPAFLVSSAGVIEIIRSLGGTFFSPADTPEQKNLFSNTKEESLSSDDKYSLTLLEEKMQAGLYRKPGLTIARLAEIINLPEHRLRKLVNQHLGHQNISQYLNNYRIEEAKIRLADIAQRQVSILEIAMEVGYVSLRPFNRAFKNRTNQTPSSYRKNCMLELAKLPSDIRSVRS